MEDLHLSYDEVMYKIPYRLLLLMKRDKMRVTYGKVMKEATDEDYLFKQ
jgi:hypothetical protein